MPLYLFIFGLTSSNNSAFSLACLLAFGTCFQLENNLFGFVERLLRESQQLILVSTGLGARIVVKKYEILERLGQVPIYPADPIDWAVDFCESQSRPHQLIDFFFQILPLFCLLFSFLLSFFCFFRYSLN